MKLILVTVLLFTLTGCGLKKRNELIADRVGRQMAEALSCALPTMMNGALTPVVVVGQENIDNILSDLQGRTFNRNSFWTLLSRKTRTRLNLTLNHQLKAPEDILYPGFVLFMENYLSHPGQNYLLKTSQTWVRFVIDSDESRMNQATCENQDTVLKKIDTTRVIPASSVELKLSCKLDNGGRFALTLYKNHLVIHRGELISYSRGEIIRKDSEEDIRITALDPDQQSLEMVLSTKSDRNGERSLYVNFIGKNQSFSGTHRCGRAD